VVERVGDEETKRDTACRSDPPFGGLRIVSRYCMYYQCCASSPLGLWIFSFVPMLHSRQARRLSLFGLLLALSLVHVSPPAQAGVEPGGIDPVGVDVVLEPSR
jgi:hypothetical protein